MKKNFLLDIPIRYAPYGGKIKWLKTILDDPKPIRHIM